MSPSEFYANLLGQVKNLLDGAADNAQFEDALRDMFTTQAYQAFTMDKIVQTMVRQVRNAHLQRHRHHHHWMLSCP